MYIVKRLSNETVIDIGRQGENEATVIEFPLTEMRANYGEGTATLVHMRQGDRAPYICQTEQLADSLAWTITSTDTAYAGTGQCELRWVVDDTLAKSIIFKTVVAPSITADSVLPDAYQSWFDAMMEVIGPTSEKINRIESNPIFDMLDGGTEINTGDDLARDAFYEPGIYWTASGSSLSNSPTTREFKMLVMHLPTSRFDSGSKVYIMRILFEVGLGNVVVPWFQLAQVYPQVPAYTNYSWIKVPTRAEYTALEARVAALEGA